MRSPPSALSPTRTSEGVVAVAQGHSTETAWPILAEAAFAIEAGALWVAANTDGSLPTPRGLAPGNGAMVAGAQDRRLARLRSSLASLQLPLIEDALARHGSGRDALVIGDRLDTDIAGGHSTGPAFAAGPDRCLHR